MNDEILKLEKQLCFRLYAVSRNMTRLYKPLLDKFNLTYPQYIIMLVMFEHKHIKFNDLSAIVDLRTGTLTPILQKLVKTGYINRIVDSTDKRKIFLELTELGEKLQKDIIEVPIGLYTQLQITPEMYKVLTTELDQLSNILKNVEVREAIE
jgi:DNA-binding MarR family transcriptional regulator